MDPRKTHILKQNNLGKSWEENHLRFIDQKQTQHLEVQNVESLEGILGKHP